MAGVRSATAGVGAMIAAATSLLLDVAESSVGCSARVAVSVVACSLVPFVRCGCGCCCLLTRRVIIAAERQYALAKPRECNQSVSAVQYGSRREEMNTNTGRSKTAVRCAEVCGPLTARQ